MIERNIDDGGLAGILERFGSVLVAWSGGVDSTLLAAVAHDRLGAERCLLVTGDSDSLSATVRERALAIAAERGWNHEMLRTAEMDRPGYAANGTDRCYHCKSELFDRLVPLAAARGLAVVVDGTNADDLADIRPGRVAAAERAVRSPLADAGLGKEAIRVLSRRLGLPTWDLPASPCLSSRVPHGEPVTAEKLRRIDAAEAVVRAAGFAEHRVRVPGDGLEARIEVPLADVARLAESATFRPIEEALLALGFTSVSVDPLGLRSGHLAREARAGGRFPSLPVLG